MSENKPSQADLNPEDAEFTDATDNTSEEEAASHADTQPDPLAETQAELAELKDKYLRLYADFENFRRRTSKERLELIATASGDVLKALLPVADDFERAIASFEAASEVEPLREGVALIFNKFFKTLESKGLKPMQAKGETFDSELHESVAQFPAPSEEMKGKVVDEVEKGYYLNDKVIRYAKVVVGV